MSQPNVDDTLDRISLRRLEALTDGVFALVLVLLLFDLPVPESRADFDLSEFFLASLDAILIVLLGLLIVIIYWSRSNVLLGVLRRTDIVHSTASILQIFFLLLYLYSVSLVIQIGETPHLLAFEAAAAALIGFASAAAWWYASSRRRLLHPDLKDPEIAAERLRVLAEPLTALTVVTLAFLAPKWANAGWLTYPVFIYLLRRLPRLLAHE